MKKLIFASIVLAALSTYLVDGTFLDFLMVVGAWFVLLQLFLPRENSCG